jgi:hypothetical protein
MSNGIQIEAYTTYIDWQASGTVRANGCDGVNPGDSIREFIKGELEATFKPTEIVYQRDRCMGFSVAATIYQRSALPLGG